MKKILFYCCFLFSSTFLFAQAPPDQYSQLINKAWSFYLAKDYKNSALTYSGAFKSNGGKRMVADRYNAACSWAMSNDLDSAFSQLNKIAAFYINYNHIVEDSDLIALRQDKRWPPLLEAIKRNKERADSKYNQPLIKKLDTIYKEDQLYRTQIADIEKKYGADSKEMKAHWKAITVSDSINLIKIKAILDSYGWLGEDVIRQQGNTTLFLVIQHSDLATQQKYLPMMREAVKNGKAAASGLALLEDRVALREGRKQIYGSQIGRDQNTKLYFVSALEDPDNVDKRRAAVGLGPLADYVSQWEIKWDVEQYKKDLKAKENKAP